MILYGRLVSPFVRRTAILLDMLGLEFEHEPLSAINEQEKVRAVSPVGRVPALRVGDETLIDSSAIALALLDEHDRQGTLMPRHGRPYKEALQLLFIANGATEKVVAGYYERTRRPEDKIHAEWVDLCETQAVSALDALNTRIGDGFSCGQTLGYVDVAIATGLTFIPGVSETVFTPERHPRLEEFRKCCEAEPAMAARPPV